MEIRCPYCEKTVQIPGGGQFTCPSCRAVFAVDLDPPAQAPASPPPPLAATQPSPLAPTAPGAAPPPLPNAGPLCAKHPDRPAAEVCRRCGNFMCSLCVIPLRGERYCPDCVDKAGGGAGTVPWENDRERLGVFGAYVATMKGVLFEPDQFYRGMPSDAGLGAPAGFQFVFGWSFGAIQMLFQAALNAAFMGAILKMAPPPGSGGPNPFAALGAQTAIGVIFNIVLFLPFFILCDIFVGGAFDHVVALLCGGKASYEATVRLRSYAFGSTAVFQAIPMVGGLVAIVWKWIAHYFGFKNVHGLSSGKALLCATYPILLGFLCCCGLIALFGFAGAMGGASGGGGGGF